MPDDSHVDHWLDQWESLREQGSAISLNQFIREHCLDAPRVVIEAFRSKVNALQSMDARIKGATGSGQSTRAGGGSHDATGRSAVRISLTPGAEPVPGYRLEKRLGQGGFGEVWRATAPGGMPVALKFVPSHPQAARAELRALEILKQVRHPHLLATVGFWQHEGHFIIAMELADRSLLDRFLEARRGGHPGIPGPELLRYLAEAAKGLDYLNEPRQPPGGSHVVGIQHRDVKPHNLLLLGGSVKVGDFGLARCLEHSQASHTGLMTAAYAAPEFFRGRTSRHSDQYGLAVTYCQLRGGRLPFTGNAAALSAGHLYREPDLSMLPAEERPAVARALAKDPKARWPSCVAFVKALWQAQARRGGPPPGGKRGKPVRGRSRILSRWLPLTAAGLLVLVGCCFAAWAVLRGPDESGGEAGSGRQQANAGVTPEARPAGDAAPATKPGGPGKAAAEGGRAKGGVPPKDPPGEGEPKTPEVAGPGKAAAGGDDGKGSAPDTKAEEPGKAAAAEGDKAKGSVPPKDLPKGDAPKTSKADGPGIEPKIVTPKEVPQDDAKLLGSALGDCPLPFVEFTPTGVLKPGEKGGLDATVRYTIKQDAYRKYVAGVEQALKKVAVRSGDVTFRLRTSSANLHYSQPGFSPQDLQVLNAVLKDERETNCRLLFIGKGVRSFVDAPVPINRYHLLHATWYLLKDAPSTVPPAAWARGKQLQLRSALLDEQGGEVGSAVVQPYRWVRGQTRSILFPGGPLGWPYSNQSLGLPSSWRYFEEHKNRRGLSQGRCTRR